MFAYLLARFMVHELPDGVRAELSQRVAEAVHVVTDGLHDAATAVEGRVQRALHLPQGTSSVPTWSIGAFMLSAVFCLGSSAAFHAFHVVDESWFTVLSSLDYAGIAVLICGSTLPMITLGFHCLPTLMLAYCIFVSVVALGTAYIGISPAFRTSEYRKIRMASFIATGCSGMLPFVHLLLLKEPVYDGALPRLLLMGALYIGGALLYGFRVPESLLPGRFDRAWQSHNIFHLCVWGACWVHYQALWAHYLWRANNADCTR